MNSWINRWLGRLKLMRISRLMLVVTLGLSVVFAGYTIYGSKVGNFLISVDDSRAYIMLSGSEPPFTELQSMLAPDGVKGMKDATYSWLDKDINEGIGSKNTEGFLASSFYLVNVSDKNIDYKVELNIIEVSKEIHKCLRVLIIEGDFAKDKGVIYAMAEETDEGKSRLEETTTYKTRDFETENRIASYTVQNFAGESHVKYTVVMWLEGNDIDCNRSILGGTIKITMNFTAL